MSITAEDPLIRSLFREPPLKDKDIIQVMKVARSVHAEDIEIANSIIPEAGDYLDRAWLYWLAGSSPAAASPSFAG
jgi:hypothetical protein